MAEEQASPAGRKRRSKRPLHRRRSTRSGCGWGKARDVELAATPGRGRPLAPQAGPPRLLPWPVLVLTRHGVCRALLLGARRFRPRPRPAPRSSHRSRTGPNRGDRLPGWLDLDDAAMKAEVRNEQRESRERERAAIYQPLERVSDDLAEIERLATSIRRWSQPPRSRTGCRCAASPPGPCNGGGRLYREG